MSEKIEKIDGALVYHGAMHNRIYFSDAPKDSLESLLPKMKNLANENRYEKILGKASANSMNVFKANGFIVEAKIPGLYNDTLDGYFLADYINEKRHDSDEKNLKTIATIKSIALAANKPTTDSYFGMPENLSIEKLSPSNFGPLEELYKKAYKYHPHQIVNKEHFTTLTDLNHHFYGLFENGNLLVSATVAFNKDEANMEIVDFVTHPDYRGQNLSYFLVQNIKTQMQHLGCKTIYAMVRATSYGLNIT